MGNTLNTTTFYVPGCTLWLDASDPNATGVPATNGAPITTWKDKSGLGCNATVPTLPITTQYTTPLNTVLTVPGGATSSTITVTVIGGGGGGGPVVNAGFNARGGIATYTFTGVTSGSTITYYVGSGGAAGTSGNHGGTNSYVTIGSTTIYAGGGGGALGFNGENGGNGIGLGGGNGASSYTTNATPGSIPSIASSGTPIGAYGNAGANGGGRTAGSNGIVQITMEAPPTINNTGLNGLPTMNFNGSSWFTGLTTNTGTTTTIFMVMQQPAQTSSINPPYTRVLSMGPLGGNDDNNGGVYTKGLLIEFVDGYILAWRANAIYSTQPVNTPYIFDYQINGTNAFSFLNGADQGSFGSTDTFTIGTYRIGGIIQYNGTPQYTGYVSEVLVFNTALTTPQRQQVETYLSKKWGIPLSYSVPTTPLLFSPTSSPIPIISNTFITNQPSIFFPPGAQMISTLNSGLGSPTIPGCQLWLDAADTTTLTRSGSRVIEWRDKSGNGYNMNKTSDTFPVTGDTINGLNTVRFATGSSIKQSTLVNGSKNFYWVGRIAAPSTLSGYFFFLMGADDGDKYNWHAYTIGSGNPYLYPYSVNTPYVPPGVSNATASQYGGGTTAAVNTTFGALKYPPDGSLTMISVSGITGDTYYQGLCYDRYIPNRGWCGDLAEVIIFSQPLTTAQHQQVEGYLATKWGLRSNLPPNHPYFSVPYKGLFALNPFGSVSKSIFITYQTPALTSTMRFATGNDISGRAFGFSQTQYFMSAPYQYGGYGDTRWTTNVDQYSLPNVLSGIYDATAEIIRGDRSFNADSDVRETAMINIISDTPYSLGRSPISSSLVTSASFHVCEIIAYNRALATTDRQMIEGYMAWKWGITNRLPIGHPYKEFPPSGEQVIIPSTPVNLMQGLISWLDMADTSSYTLSGTTLKTIRDKATVAGTFTISGKPNNFSFSNIGSLPALVFPGNNTSTISANTFLFRTVPVPSQGSACMVLVPKSQFTATKLGVLGWGNLGNGNFSGNIALGYNAATVTVQTLRSYNTATNTFFGPSLNLAANTPTILFWAWYAGNMVYFSCNGTTLLSSAQGTYYNSASTDSQFFIGNDGGFGAQFTLGELVMYNQYGETPFRNLIEGHLAWKWGLQTNLPAYHPYYYSAPGLQSLTEVNALSQPSDIPNLTMWLDAADTTTTQQVNSAVTFTGSPTLLGVLNGYTYYAFRGNGSITSATPLEIQYFAVGGGGGGGFDYGAGGGAGGLQTNTSVYVSSSQVSKITPLVPGATYSITIGTGGAYQVGTNPYRGGSGGNTTFVGTGISVTANGGGGGGGGGVGSGGAGGSGGGGGYPYDTSLNPGGIGSQGGNGITGVFGYWGGAGGGIGGNATSGGPTPLNGGPGLQFFGTFYGGGGGGAGWSGNSVGSGGSGVGGTGAYGNGNQGTGFLQGIPPVANSGGGGAGGGGNGIGTAGAAGIFIIGIPLTQSVWIDKSAVANHVYSTTPGNAPTLSNFGTARRPSVYFGPGKTAVSAYNSGASTAQFSAFMVASVPTLSYLLISSGQYTTGTTPLANQSFGFYGSNGALAGVCSPFTGGGGTKVGNYSTICGATVELFASVNGLNTLGNLNFGSTVSGTCGTIPATPWVFGDCLGDPSPKSFHVHEFITFSRQLATNERWIIEGYLYWKWMHLI